MERDNGIPLLMIQAPADYSRSQFFPRESFPISATSGNLEVDTNVSSLFPYGEGAFTPSQGKSSFHESTLFTVEPNAPMESQSEYLSELSIPESGGLAGFNGGLFIPDFTEEIFPAQQTDNSDYNNLDYRSPVELQDSPYSAGSEHCFDSTLSPASTIFLTGDGHSPRSDIFSPVSISPLLAGLHDFNIASPPPNDLLIWEEDSASKYRRYSDTAGIQAPCGGLGYARGRSASANTDGLNRTQQISNLFSVDPCHTISSQNVEENPFFDDDRSEELGRSIQQHGTYSQPPSPSGYDTEYSYDTGAGSQGSNYGQPVQEAQNMYTSLHHPFQSHALSSPHSSTSYGTSSPISPAAGTTSHAAWSPVQSRGSDIQLGYSPHEQQIHLSGQYLSPPARHELGRRRSLSSSSTTSFAHSPRQIQHGSYCTPSSTLSSAYGSEQVATTSPDVLSLHIGRPGSANLVSDSNLPGSTTSPSSATYEHTGHDNAYYPGIGSGDSSMSFQGRGVASGLDGASRSPISGTYRVGDGLHAQDQHYSPYSPCASVGPSIPTSNKRSFVERKAKVGTQKGVNAATKRRRKPAQYHCEICPNRHFTARHNLKHHMNAHFGIKPFACTMCHMPFRTSSDRGRHEKKGCAKETKHP